MEYTQQRMVQEAAKHAETSTSLITPLNTVLLGLVVYVGYQLFKSSPPPTLPKQEPPTVFRTFTPQTLLENNGRDGKPILLGIRGRVFDVSRKPHFYGPGGPYENFAGRDATQGLAKGSFDKEMLTEDLTAPLYDPEALNAEEREALMGWEESFSGNYPVVGRLISQAEFDALKKE
ncbi:Uncharacterized protein SAPIO_CDS0119 [Scedosporium apiospermum]|uniref:Cytochrome b5 heme-binding domain-containing protein n=1 Tax=Pseudallescheria apiosperma TaxID=563466 RepID=A0A084GHK2_PSEDA|nr:Uncharacterized protein SAPIO_CDS0119 [Scedosporium apiospermum]KEZ46814.1 Uncharacterized protein SAPIO_CDS0119 [Scedosporium apiospermum]